jgi:hypothetical protein
MRRGKTKFKVAWLKEKDDNKYVIEDYVVQTGDYCFR